jgi:hypothetical protein
MGRGECGGRGSIDKIEKKAKEVRERTHLIQEGGKPKEQRE